MNHPPNNSIASHTPQKDDPQTERIIKFSTLFIALLSLLVSVCSVWFTVTAQKTDQTYREVLIQPRLGRFISPEDVRIELKNVGLGPASITRVAFQSDTYHFDSDTDDIVFDTFTIGLLNGLHIHASTSTPQSETLFKRWFSINYRDGIFAAGDAIDLIAFNKSAFDDTSEDDKKNLDLAALNNVKAQLWNRTVSAKYRICYCSLTRKFCTYLDVLASFPEVQCRDDLD
jgi:hypothetical protein